MLIIGIHEINIERSSGLDTEGIFLQKLPFYKLLF